jgi:hypothetical protein
VAASGAVIGAALLVVSLFLAGFPATGDRPATDATAVRM